MTDDPAKPPRFPYIAALLCAACVGAAVWSWMRYSYAWPIAPRPLAAAACEGLDEWLLANKHGRPPRGAREWHLRYVELLEAAEEATAKTIHGDPADSEGAACLSFEKLPVEVCADWATVETLASRNGWVGRVYLSGHGVVVDSRDSRFTGASIAGLVVGAMGVFVFTVALRHWLKERRRFQERQAGITRAWIGHPPPVDARRSDGML